MSAARTFMKLLVIIPTHDRRAFLNDALDSLADQTLQPNKVVIIGNVGPECKSLESLLPADEYQALVYNKYPKKRKPRRLLSGKEKS